MPSRVVITAAAWDKLNADPMLREWKRDPRPDEVPILHYYRRCYSTAWDGMITEHGDGFALAFVDPREALQAHVEKHQIVTSPDGYDIRVEIHRSFAPGVSTIGLRKGGYTYEPDTSRSKNA